MRGVRRLVQEMVITALLAGCGGYSPTAPAMNPGGGGSGGGSGAGGGTGGDQGGGGGGGPVSTAVTVTVGNDFFRSDRNGTANAAVDTIVAGGRVTWTWANTGAVPHSIQSLSSPSFTSSAIETGSGSTYQMTFTVPGTYRYDCAVHGAAMSGTVVVLAP